MTEGYRQIEHQSIDKGGGGGGGGGGGERERERESVCLNPLIQLYSGLFFVYSKIYNVCSFSNCTRRVYFCVKKIKKCAHLQPLLDIAVLVDWAEFFSFLPSSLHMLFSCVLKTSSFLSKNNYYFLYITRNCVNCEAQLYFIDLQLT